MKAAAVAVPPLLGLLMWASWPAPFPKLDPLDARAIELLRDLERNRPGAWDAILRARDPRTVPALMTLASRDELFELLHPTPVGEVVNGLALVRPREVLCCEWGQRPHPPADAFESALQAATAECDITFTLKDRGRGRVSSLRHFELRERLKDPEPGVRFAAAYQLWRWESPRDIPSVLALLGEHAFARFPWLDAVADRVRRESAPEAVREGARAGRLRAMAIAAFLRRRDAVPEIVPRLNGAGAADAAWVLGEIGDPLAVPALEALLESPGWLGGDAAEALGKIGRRSALPALRAALEGTKRGYKRARIERALEKLRP